MGGAVAAVPSADAFNAALKDAKDAGKAVIVDFTATWCGPCKMIKPFYAELSEKYSSVVFLMVDVDELDTVTEAAGVSAMPTFQVYKDGAKVDELCGASKEKLEALVSKYA